MDMHATSMDASSLTDSEVSNLNSIMRQCNFNWFEFMKQGSNQQVVDQFYTHHLGGFSQGELEQIKLSHEAYLADEHLYGEKCERTAQEINGDIVTDSESDNPSVYLKSVHDEASQELIAKKVAAIKRQIRRKRAKYISQQHFWEERSLKV